MYKKGEIKKYLLEFKLHNNKTDYYYGALFFLIFFSIFWIFLTSIPINSSLPKTFTVESGSSLAEIANSLKEQHFIRSKTIFTSLVIFKKGETKIISGEYLFTDPTTFFTLIHRLTTGDYGIERKQVRIPEGSTLDEMGRILETNFPDFDKEVFYQLTEGKEGYLFPDTYFFLENVKAYEVVKMLQDTFNEKIETLKLETKTNINLRDIIIMASIIEGEADKDSKQAVSNILWKRIRLDMALQVDAPFVYSIGKGTFDLSNGDLKDKENPYNTYVNKGLPPTPISNPGLESLKAAATPAETPYLYFLTGHDGNMYYAETFEGHKKNRKLHL